MTTEQIKTADVTSPIVNSDNPPPPVESPIVDAVPNIGTPIETPPISEPAAAVVLNDGKIPAEDPKGQEWLKNTPDWFQKKINKATAQKYEAERAADQERQATTTEREKRIAAESRAAELLAQVGKTTAAPTVTAEPPKVPMGEEEIERRAVQKAQDIARANEFNKACNTIVETGKSEFKDWDEAVKNLSMVGAIGQNVSPEFLETAIELKDPHRILHYLGSNLEEAEKIVKATPKQMALQMARIEAMLNAPKPAAPPAPISNAPAPVITVGGAAKPGAPSLEDPDLRAEEWMKLRDQQVMDRKSRYRRA